MKCVTCGVDKHESEFNWRWKALGIKQKSCRECQHGHQQSFYHRHQETEKERTRRKRVKAREEARDFIWGYKTSHPCQNCGEADPVVLDFHHVRGKGKNVGTLIVEGASIQRIKNELDLCVVVCSNCHRKITHSQRRG